MDMQLTDRELVELPLPSAAKMRRRIGTEKINGAVPSGNGQNGGAWHDICMI